MRVAVIGAGVAGISTAYELTLRGHEVQVFERDTSVATGASFAPPGLIAPGLLAARPPARLKWRGAPGQLGWRWAHWRARRASAQQPVPAAVLQLATQGQALMNTWRQALQMEIEQRAGVLLLWRSAKEYRQAAPMLARLQAAQIAHREVDAATCRLLEPGLHPDTPLHGGIHLPQDESANARQFSQALKQEAQRLGARWQFNAEVLQIDPGTQPSLHLATGPAQRVDAVVVCAGKGAPSLLGPLGLRFPWGKVHAHTLTAPLRQLEAHPDLGPSATVIDVALGVSMTRLGQRVRIGGAQELGGATTQPDGQSLGALHQAAHDWFPGALQAGGQQRWKASRLLLPDELPVVGASGVPGVWLNIGHGEAGWALAGGAAQWLGERLAGRDGGLDPSVLEAARLR
ncbi:D-amino-acid dehydrogenase [Roseateles sp. YR242]|uniref:FAD-dependent oxidoreductase n=1 Tax=Roseateles sp. YR242 TaxID=1855305 RepID=UPI0008C995B6|nr:FAD-dependent oxidoreductase [Roseateles sp. YR242]SEL56158.1 D-amino-acid dehydrogenase [Roseateles sp. YR242]